MLIKDENAANVVLGDTLGDGKTGDGFKGERFHYLMANPPFGVEWKDQKNVVEHEHNTTGFSGHFGAGLPAINDGSLLFLQHMISKMHPYDEEDEDQTGSKIAIVFNGSPLFSGEAGSGPSNIRRWIIENDWLDAIVALPDQLFYNTGIFTYVWLVTNRKPPERRGKMQLIDGTRFYRTMKKSLNNKRNEISEEQIRELTRVYGNYEDGATAGVSINGETETRVISRIFENREFGFLKVTVERPLRMNFETTPERIAKLDDQTAFANLAKSRKRKDEVTIQRETAEGRKRQEAIRTALRTLEVNGRSMDRAAFEADVLEAAESARVKIPAPIKKAIFAALGERDLKAEICWDGKGRPEPDSELRDTENIPLPPGTALPLPMNFGPDKPNDELVADFRDDIDAYIKREVLPHVPDAWVDYTKTKVGYEIPVNRHFYVYKPPRPLDRIEADIVKIEGDITKLLKGLVRRCQIQSGQVDPREPDYTDMVLIAPDHIESGTGRLIEVARAGEQGAISGKYLCPEGAILYSKIRPALRKVALNDGECLCSADMYAIDPGCDLDRKYLFYFLLTDTFTSYAELESLRVAMPKVNREALGAFPITVPRLDEQREIVRFCEGVDQDYSLVTDKIRESVVLLEEYRSAQITVAVTGQVTPLL